MKDLDELNNNSEFILNNMAGMALDVSGNDNAEQQQQEEEDLLNTSVICGHAQGTVVRVGVSNNSLQSVSMESPARPGSNGASSQASPPFARRRMMRGRSVEEEDGDRTAG